jgi:hypothetical protein
MPADMATAAAPAASGGGPAAEPAPAAAAATAPSEGKLAEQDITKVKLEDLHPLHPMVMSRQATINVGAGRARGSARRAALTPAIGRHHRPCGARQEHGREGHLGRAGALAPRSLPQEVVRARTVARPPARPQTVRFKTELERNITIKLGYANAKIYKCDNPKCPRPDNYRAFGSSKEDRCGRAGAPSERARARLTRRGGADLRARGLAAAAR